MRETSSPPPRKPSEDAVQAEQEEETSLQEALPARHPAPGAEDRTPCRAHLSSPSCPRLRGALPSHRGSPSSKLSPHPARRAAATRRATPWRYLEAPPGPSLHQTCPHPAPGWPPERTCHHAGPHHSGPGEGEPAAQHPLQAVPSAYTCRTFTGTALSPRRPAPLLAPCLRFRFCHTQSHPEASPGPAQHPAPRSHAPGKSLTPCEPQPEKRGRT